jgi:hypothetical protein
LGEEPLLLRASLEPQRHRLGLQQRTDLVIVLELASEIGLGCPETTHIVVGKVLILPLLALDPAVCC